MPKVSIVLPTYNGENYIEESIKSIMIQTFSDWELIVINDCSTDHTLEIIQRYASVDKRIKVICNHENMKLPHSLNVGFAHAKGDFFTWTSDDNVYCRDAIELMYQYLSCHEKEYMVCADMNIIDERGSFIREHVKYDQDAMLFNDCVGACFLYRKEVITEIGEYDEERFLVEDYDYWLRILFQYGKIGHLDKILYYYRCHSESLTSTKKEAIHAQLCRLRRKYFSQIAELLMDKEKYLTMMYLDFDSLEDCESVKEICFRYVPILKKLSKLNSRCPVTIYGAGKVGNEVYKWLDGKVDYFIDSNPQKVGTYKNDKKIISLNDFLLMKQEHQIVIGVGIEKVLDVMKLLDENGIKKYSYMKCKEH